jgi:hypothetical protein
VNNALLVLYLFTIEDTFTQMIQKMGLSEQTVSDWLKCCRQLVMEVVLVNEDDTTVGSER